MIDLLRIQETINFYNNRYGDIIKMSFYFDDIEKKYTIGIKKTNEYTYLNCLYKFVSTEEVIQNIDSMAVNYISYIINHRKRKMRRRRK